MIASYSIRSRIDKEMKWNTGPQFNTESSYFSIPTEGRTRKFVESERAILPRIVESDEGNPPLMLEGEA